MLDDIQLLAISPLIITGTLAVLLMLVIAFFRHHNWNATLTVAGLNLVLLTILVLWILIGSSQPIPVTDLLLVDAYACFFMALMTVATLACCTLAHTYLKYFDDFREEFYLLLVLSLLGAMVLVCSRHFAAVFIGLELLTIPLYGLAAYNRKNARSLEAGIKYLVVSAGGSAMMLFGIALLYADTGSLSLVGNNSGSPSFIILSGVTLVLVALSIKLSLVPFHLWTPDVYEGTPSPAAAYLATVAKIAVAAVLLRWIAMSSTFADTTLQSMLMLAAGLSMIIGNLLAMQQNNLKRLLAYSSIAHLGYLLTALSSFNFATIEACMVYLFTYTFATLVAFGVVALHSTNHRRLASHTSADDANGLHHYRGLFWKQPYLAVVMTVAMLSLAGMPMSMGFIGKFYVVLAAVNAAHWWLLAALVIGSGIGLYYYLRVIITLFLREPGLADRSAPTDWSLTACGVMLILCSVLILLFGVYPEPLLDVAAAGHLF